ncbi:MULTISPECIES: N-acetyltransferase [Rhodococcus]|uniref:N-acetyltransferase n=1 Tax=Rhodococcus TaxID=1827 RepID=UPI0006BB535D|nr:hypothetical protein GFS60_07416 [Rhodococcus sp. WAY2]
MLAELAGSGPLLETRVLSVMDEDVSLYDIAEDFPDALGAGWSSGELTGREVDVAIWVAPECRKKGYGAAAVEHSRQELAAEVPRHSSSGSRTGLTLRRGGTARTRALDHHLRREHVVYNKSLTDVWSRVQHRVHAHRPVHPTQPQS